MQGLRIALVLLFCAIAAQAHGQAYLLARIGAAAPRKTALVSIRRDEKCELIAVLERAGHYYSGEAGPATIGGADVKLEAWPADQPVPAIRWFKVEPEMKHKAKGADPTVPGYLWYANAYVPQSPTGRQRWIGFDKITYHDNNYAGYENKWRISPDAHPTDPEYDICAGLGTMRFAVEIKLGDKTWRTPGAASTDYLGIESKVFKLLVREDDSFAGHATSWCNVPGVFGSHELQVDRHLGVDCADLVVGAYRQWKGSKLEYTGVNGLPDCMTKVGKPLYLAPSGELFTAADQKEGAAPIFERGMVVILNYPGAVENWYQHVVILYKDNGNGVVDGDDLTLQCGPIEPNFAKLQTQAMWPGRATRMQLLRWK